MRQISPAALSIAAFKPRPLCHLPSLHSHACNPPQRPDQDADDEAGPLLAPAAAAHRLLRRPSRLLECGV